MKRSSKIFTGLLLALCTVLALTGCTDGVIQTRTDDVSGFDKIEINTFGEFIIEQGDEESLKIEAPRDYLRYITSEVEGSTLIIDTRRGFVGGPIRHITYTLTVKDLEEISLSGAGAIKIFALETEQFKMDLTGAGSIEIDELYAENLDINLTSAGAIVIAGEVDSQEVNISGVGSYEAGDLRSDTARILLTGAGSAVVWAEESLDVNITGVGSVSYFGDDPQVSQSVSGLGSINSKGSR